MRYLILDDSICDICFRKHMNVVEIDGNNLSIEESIAISQGKIKVRLSKNAIVNMQKSRDAVENILSSDDVVYGINTGFGALSSVKVDLEDLDTLQSNLIRSHACGIGENMEPEHVFIMMLFRANSLAKGVSGCRVEIVEFLLNLINLRIAPAIPRIGSLGASGDLAPLSHMALVLIGEGECYIEEDGGWNIYDSKHVLSKEGINPIILKSKEGLSLINGTSQMCAYLCYTIRNLEQLLMVADFSLACSLESIKGSHSPFDYRIHEVRPQKGQLISAARISGLLKNSQIKDSHKDCDRVQDAYCFRCGPQVHGPAIEALIESRRILEIEINSATDNPLVFVNEGKVDIISGGNFHGQNLAIASDNLAIICHEIAVISERRINQILDPQWSNLSAFLTNKEGLESGLMIIQYVAAAIISELHLLANPATTSNVPVSMGKEDHVSMGATGTYRSLTSSKYLSQVLANELICATEALERLNESPGLGVAKIKDWVRTKVDKLDGDKSLTKECEELSISIINGEMSEIFR